MALVVSLILGFLFLDGWMRYALIAGGALIELAEIGVWLRWRNVRATTGMESMIGMTAVAISDCAPDGQVKIKGQIWKASAARPIEAGTEVRITDVNGLELRIEAT